MATAEHTREEFTDALVDIALALLKLLPEEEQERVLVDAGIRPEVV